MMADSEDKKLLLETLTERLLSDLEPKEKARILRLIQKMRQKAAEAFWSRSQMAEHYGISIKKLNHDLFANKPLVKELNESGWKPKNAGFYPKQISIIQKYLGL